MDYIYLDIWIQIVKVHMKVIKHLRHESPSHRFRIFFKQMPLLTRLFLTFTLITSIILAITDASRQFAIYSFLDARPLSEMLLFLIVALTDMQNQQRKGSIFLFLSYIIKISIIAGFNSLIALLLSLFTDPNILSTTSYPLLYCLCIGFRDMIIKSGQNRYFLISSFQIKYIFYPIFLVIILELAGFRIDLMTTFFVGVLATGIKLDEIIGWVSKKLDKKCIGEKAASIGLLATGALQIEMSQIDRVSTNHSVVLQQN